MPGFCECQHTCTVTAEPQGAALRALRWGRGAGAVVRCELADQIYKEIYKRKKKVSLGEKLTSAS